MNILIVGLGNIGKSHLKGLLNASFKKIIYIYDKKKINLKDKELIFLEKIPQKKKFDLVILATDVRDRLLIIKKILKNNIVKYLLLEKYIFKSLKEFDTFEKNYLKKIKKDCFVNCWGQIILDNIKLGGITKNFQMNVSISSESFLSSFIHFLQIFQILSKSSDFSINKKNLKLMNSKRKNYKELQGKFIVENKNGSNMIYVSDKIRYGFIINIKFKNKSYSIFLDNKFYLNIKSNKIFKKIKFPMSYLTTSDLIINIYKNKRKNIKLPKYREINDLNKKILIVLKDILTGNKFT